MSPCIFFLKFHCFSLFIIPDSSTSNLQWYMIYHCIVILDVIYLLTWSWTFNLFPVFQGYILSCNVHLELPLRCLLLGRKVMTNLDSIFKSRDITLPTKVRLVKAMVFPVVMYGCESWTVKKAEHQRIDAFELWCWRRVLSPLDCKEIQPVHSEGDQPWDFFGRNDAEAESPLVWPLHVKSWLIGKDSDAGRDWGQEKKGTTEDDMVGWHHWLNGRESE